MNVISGGTTLAAIALWRGGTLALGGVGFAHQLAAQPSVRQDRPADQTVRFETTAGTWMNVDVAPDGRTIVFDLLGDIYAVGVTGGSATRLTSGLSFDTEPAFSPDGKQIVFVSDRSGSDNLWVMDVDGQNLHAFTRDTAAALSVPEWITDSEFVLVGRKPDGYWLFRADGSGVALRSRLRPAVTPGAGVAGWSRDGREVYVPTSGGVRRFDLATGASELVSPSKSPSRRFRPMVSPDGRWLVIGGQERRKTGLRIRNLATQHERWLIYPLPDQDKSRMGEGAQAALPRFAFMPDSRAIILAIGGTLQRLDLGTGSLTPIRFRAAVEQVIRPRAAVAGSLPRAPDSIRAIQSAQQNLARTHAVFTAVGKIWLRHGRAPATPLITPRAAPPSLLLREPAFAPDGRSVAFVSWHDVDQGHLWRVSLNGDAPQQLTLRPGVYRHPVWSPNGSMLAVVREDETGAQPRGSTLAGEVYLLPAAGGAPRHLIASAADDAPAFAADGERVLVVARRASGAPIVLAVAWQTGQVDTVGTLPADAEQVALAADGLQVAYTVGTAVYTTALQVIPASAVLVSSDGGVDLRWEGGNRVLTWVRNGTLVRVAIGQTAAEAETLDLTLPWPRAESPRSLALEGATVITMRGEEILRNATVLVTGDRIAAVGVRGAVALPPGVHRLDVSGKTIIPGLIDVRGNVALERDGLEVTNRTLAANLGFGVTTVRAVPTGVAPMEAMLKQAAAYEVMLETGTMTGARLVPEGAIADAASELTSLDAARALVRRQQMLGATAVVQMEALSRQQQQWLAAAASEAGLVLIGEGTSLRRALTMAADGYHTIQGALPDAQIYDDVRQFLAAAGTMYVPTLLSATADNGASATAEAYFHTLTEVDQDPTLWRLGLAGNSWGRWQQPGTYHFLAASQQVARLAARGMPVAVGTAGTNFGLGVHWEMWALEAGGLSPHAALRAATVTSAAALGLARELGTIEAGKVADLVVLDADPLTNVRHSRAIRYVVRNGVLFDAVTLGMVWPARTPALSLRATSYDPPKRSPRVGGASAYRASEAASGAIQRSTTRGAGMSMPAPAPAESRSRLPIRAARTISFETTEGSKMHLDLSPDGRTLVFTLLGDIYTLPVIGGTATQLTRGLEQDELPVWSPDGTHIAYSSDATGEPALWVMQADGSNARAVTSERQPPPYDRPVDALTIDFRELEWMPDGRHLLSGDSLFPIDGAESTPASVPASSRFSSDGRYAFFQRWPEIRRYDLATGRTVHLALPRASPVRPVVSPDGRWLTYFTANQKPNNGLRVRNLETGEDRWLVYPIRDGFRRYVFTPDSRAVILAYGGRIHRIDVATGDDLVIPFTARLRVDVGPYIRPQRRVINDSLLAVRYIRWPDVSPDGRTLLFMARRRLYTLALPDGTPKPLVRQDVDQFFPAYSPDGQWIAYVTWRDGDGGHVWRVPATGGTPERLTEAPGYYKWPSWSPDGRTLAVLYLGPKDLTSAENPGSTAALQLLPSTGGRPRSILEAVSIETGPIFTADGQRILVQEIESQLVGNRGGSRSTLASVTVDGSDRRVVARTVPTVYEMKIVPSPDGRYVAYTVGRDLFVAPLAGVSDSISFHFSTGAGPVIKLTPGLDLRWDARSTKLTWVSGPEVYRLDPESALAGAQSTASRQKVSGGVPPWVGPHKVIPIHLTVARRLTRGTLALRGARVVTMRGDEVIEQATLVIRDDRIVALGPASSVVIPKGATVVDARGKTIIPGLIDLHAHVQPSPLLQRSPDLVGNLAYGITTVREVSGGPSQFDAAERIEVGDLLGPRFFGDGHQTNPFALRIESLEDARLIVRHLKRLGAVVVKQYDQPTRRRRQWIVQAAAESGQTVTAHPDPGQLVDGYTGVEHSWGIGTDVYHDVTHLMAEAKTWYTPTLATSELAYPFRSRYRWLYDDPKFRRFADADKVERFFLGEWTPDDVHRAELLETARRAAKIVRQGGRVGAGSHGDDPGIAMHWEIWILQEGGLTNLEALRVATLHGAEALGMEQDLGSLEVGKLADLLILDKNPLDDIENTLAIRQVMKNGELYDGETLETRWPLRRTVPAWMYAEPSVPIGRR